MPAIEMPHALKFLRAHSSSMDGNSKRPDKKTLRSASGKGTRPVIGTRNSSQSSVRSSDVEGKRLSIAGAGRTVSGKMESRVQPLKIDTVIESPPLVYYGTIQQSSGALLSGQLQLHVSEEKVLIKSVQLKLVISVRHKRPFHQHCPDCAQQTIELKEWDFVKVEKELKKGTHNIPFSHLLQGHLPITMHGTLCVIDYLLKAVVTPVNGPPLFLQRDLAVSRAIPEAELPKQSIRIFPPTNLTAHVELPNVIYPIGEFQCLFRLDGIIKRNLDSASQTHWKLKRLTWRLEETQKVISPACTKHALKAGALEGEKKGMAHSEVRLLNTEEMKSGWKCDYTSATGSIECMFPFSIRGDAEPLCDVKAEDGTEVSHALVVEMIVAEEFAPIKKPTQSTPTGAARVLRMHFNTIVTERSGMGISWDEEQPPLYEDIPGSPPHYPRSRFGSLVGSFTRPGAHNGGGESSLASSIAGTAANSADSSPTLTTVDNYVGTPLWSPHSGPAPAYEGLDRIEALRI